MYGIINYPLYFIGVLGIVFLPGPNSMYCLNVASRFGAREASKVMLAIFIGDSILMTLTAGGAASVLRANPMLFNVLKIGGGVYLAHMGINMLRGACRAYFQTTLPTHHNHHEKQPENVVSPRENVFKRGLTLSLMNPKAILFFLSFFIPFVNPTYPHPVLSFLILAATLQTVNMLYLAMLARVGSKVAAWFRGKHKVAATSTALIGILFCVFAINLWFAAL